MRDLDYLLRRAEMTPQVQVLAAVVVPPDDLHDVWNDSRFNFMGFEILDVHGDISALTNCGGFPDAFNNAELGAFGLLDSLERARDIKGVLEERYKGHGHEVCDVWGVWRMDGSG